MSALLAERAKRQEKKRTEAEKRHTPKPNSNSDDEGLRNLIESVKRKSSSADKSSGKRRKM